MKLIKQTQLLFQDDRSDKVYEVDLCEVGVDRYVVNFRYGRRGSRLKEGTKTESPASLTQANQIFDQLVASKVKKGYHDIQAPAPPSPAPSSIPTVDDPHHQAILNRLGGQGNPKWSLERAIWRAGELQVTAATPQLLALLGSGDGLRDYCLVAALGRCGTVDTVPALTALCNDPNTPDFVQRIAQEAIRKLSDQVSRTQEQERLMALLPAPLQPFTTEALQVYLQGDDPQRFSILEQLYQIDTLTVRSALLEQLCQVPVQPPVFQHLRHIFKQAEYRQDAEVFGILSYRWETTKAMYRKNRYGVSHPQVGYLSHERRRYNYEQRKWEKLDISDFEREIKSPNSRLAYGEQTRHYLRCRVWRTLRKLGEDHNPDYVNLAVGILQHYRDSDAHPPQETVFRHWQWLDSERRWQEICEYRYADAYSSYFVFNQILYGNSSRYLLYKAKLEWRCREPYKPGDPVPGNREEAFPQLWSENPAAVVKLLLDSCCHPVHQFGVKVLADCPDFCTTLDLQTLLQFLKKPYPETVELGLNLGVKYYDPNHPNFDLVLGYAACILPQGRQQAYQWLESNPELFVENTDFMVALITADQPETRQFSQRLLGLASMREETAKILIARVIAYLLSLSETANDIAQQVSEVMLAGFSSQLRSLGMSVIRDLLRHPLPALSEFAARILLNHQTPAIELPADLITDLIESPYVSVRQVGMEIFGQLPDRTLLQEQRQVILAMAVSSEADIREAIQPIIQRLASIYVEFALTFATDLIQILRVPERHEGVHNSIVKLLKSEIPGWQDQATKEIALQLLRTRSPAAQELAGIILQHHHTQWAPEFETLEIIKLANHEIAAVRGAARHLFQENLERYRENTSEMLTAVKLLEAKWDDSREFAWQIFRESFSESEWVPEVMISICDSVKADVRQFGRDLVTRTFEGNYGQEYLLKFSEHPSADMQIFATHYLETYAQDNLEHLQQLTPYFTTLLCQVNKGRVAKTRVLDFLAAEAEKSEAAAEIVAEILTPHSGTILITDKSKILQILLKIHQQYPQISVPLEVKPVVAIRT